MASLFSTPTSTSTSYLFRKKSSLYGTVFPLRCDRKPGNLRSTGYFEISCRLSTRAKESSPSPALNLNKEPHKYFDQVVITVRSGDGGHGAVLNMPNQKATKPPQGKVEKEKARRRGLLKRDFGGSLILPTGGHGGDVVIYADEEEDTLLEFHKKGRYNAKRGGNVAAMGVLTSQLRDGVAAPTLRIPVPVGTVVKRKRGTLLRDLAQPGDEILVARGGQGGISLVEMPERSKKKLMALTTNVMRDDSDKVLSLGQPGEEFTLELILRVVADVGLVGLPNAGKSTLLAATTLAKPDIADYPFTTLMPNLGRLNGDPSLGAQMYTSEATLADLPGLIEGAHLGKELRMYNPDYLDRPYIVVLNKIDIPKVSERLPSLTEEIMRLGSDRPSTLDTAQTLSTEGGNADVPSSGVPSRDRKEKGIEDYPRPIAIVGVSVLKGIRTNEMLKEIRAALRMCRD
ncbi:probable GTP-binding protein OBGC2 isoform X2 [Rosa chinensis]|uniref:probable GTP-binding protein OBGC2 isoform X2 n=1 Tax=Rosa chinensis TaxID=74649 RepID=UPI000D08CED9|nr:probable GTP-binding protein OBGC2 isoform X2 [Rosa chinensis]